MVEAGVRREGGARRVLVRLVGDERDALDADGAHLLGNLLDGQTAVIALAAGHRHGIVEQDLVGDACAGADRMADGHQA